VKQTKTTENPSQGHDKSIANNWKTKAHLRGQENTRLRKRIKELTQSRDKWHAKYSRLRNTPKHTSALGGQKAKGHQYSLVLIVPILELHKYGAMSLLSCRHSVACMLVALGLSTRVPSHSTIRNWLCKGGFHRVGAAAAKKGSYVVYVDESIVFGSEKILLILGVPVSDNCEIRALQHTDMEVLFVGANTEWKAEHIEEELLKIGKNKSILYAVSDEGNNLRKAYKSMNTVHVADCTHILANALKRLYDKDADFTAFRHLIGDLRKRWNLSKENSVYMPPTMRGKMRFARIGGPKYFSVRTMGDAVFSKLVKSEQSGARKTCFFTREIGIYCHLRTHFGRIQNGVQRT
jgi:hypothetical protein